MFWHALSVVGLGVIDVFAGIADKGLLLHPMVLLLIKKDPISQTGAVNGESLRGAQEPFHAQALRHRAARGRTVSPQPANDKHR